MQNPYQASPQPVEAETRTTFSQPSKNKTVWGMVGSAVMWFLTGIVLLTVGWPFAIAYAVIWSNNKNRLAEKEILERNVHSCPSCSRELAKTSRICPRCGHKFT